MNTVRTSIAKAIALIAVVSASGFAAAADTQTLVVTATVSGVCKFDNTNTLTMSPATAIDPSGTANVTMTRTLNYKCTNGLTAGGVTATTASGAVRNMVNGTDNLPYTLSWTGGTALGTGFSAAATNNPVVFTGTITPAQFQDAKALTFTDNVVLNITP